MRAQVTTVRHPDGTTIRVETRAPAPRCTPLAPPQQAAAVREGSRGRLEAELQPEPELEAELEAWRSERPPLGFDSTTLQFFDRRPRAPDPTTAGGEGLPSFGALGLLAHPHLWCYDSEGAFPFMPMLLVQARPPRPAPDGTDGSAALLESRLQAPEACTVAQALSVLSEQWGEGWSEERFVVLHRAFIPTPCAKLTCERTDELSLMYHACESPLRRSAALCSSRLGGWPQHAG